MKSYTDIEQSKKLAKILPLESADMFYFKRSWRNGDYVINVGNSKELQEGFEAKCIEYIPAWSLNTLLAILENPMLLKRDGLWHLYIDDSTSCLKFNNPIDACYEMILKLNKEGLL